MLRVPPVSTLVIPPPATPKPEPREERPPRTLHQAAEQAKRKREKEAIDEAELAELAAASEPPTPEPATLEVDPPPLPPPPARPIEETATTAASLPTPTAKYRNLRRYCRYLRVNATGIACLTGLLVVGELAYFVIQIVNLLNSGVGNSAVLALLTAGLGVFVVAGTALAGLFWYVLINAIAEFFHVLMDIEENTRE